MEVETAVVAPLCPHGRDWGEPDRIEAAEQSLLMLTNKWPGSSHAMTISGFSMGARGVWTALTRAAHQYDRALIVAGRVPAQLPTAQAAVALKMVHGSRDDHEPVMAVRSLYTRALNAGWNIEFEEVESGDHFIAEETYRRDDIARWLSGGAS